MSLKYLDIMVDLMEDYNHTKNMIKADIKLLENFTYINGIDYDSVNVAPTNKFNSSTERLMIKKSDIEARLYSNKMKINKIDAAINLLNDIERQIVVEYYIKDWPWVVVALNAHLSEKQSQRKRNKALIRMGKYIFGEELDEETGNSQLIMNDLKI